MYQTTSNIRQFTIELTSRCNAACPMCSRYNSEWDTRSPNSELPMTDLNLDIFKKFWYGEWTNNIELVLFNGKFGDPLVHHDLIDFIKHVNTNCTVFTNGSLRSKSWWEELAKTNCKVIFGIDGLEDTNHIYRQKTNFNKIVDNAIAFIDAGGDAEWEFIAFRHNEHQVNQAKLLSIEIGFNKFTIRKTNRFKDNNTFVYTDINGNTANLEPSMNYAYDYNGTYLGGDTPPEILNINCDWRNSNKMFLSMSNKVWPCSYISEFYPELPGFNTMKEISSRHGTEFNDISKYSLEEILNHDFFARELENAWKTGKNITKECWKKCSVGCRSITELE